MLKFVRQWIIDTLGFSKSEANGTLVLILLILSIAILPKIYMHNTFTSSNGFIDSGESPEKWAEELKMALVKKTDNKEPAVTESEKKIRSYSFDPNTATIDQLQELGFSEKTAHIVINFREKGGSFRVKSDLMKIYGISETRVNELREYIRLPDKLPEKAEEPVTGTTEEPAEKELKLKINHATDDELRQIHGIGKVLSARIINFRDALGGFHSLDQLEEIYGLDPGVVKALQAASDLSGGIARLSINTDSASHLYKHPYIDPNTAYAIVNYRAQHGNYDSISQIKRIKIVSDSLYQKLYPYLSLNQ